LVRLKPQRIVVVGGEAAVSAPIETALQTYAPEVVRIGGLNRFHTAQLLAEDAFDGPVPIAYIATGRDFPDALAAAAAAGAQGGPVLLTEAGFLPQPTLVALNTLQPSQIIVVGGTAAVADPVQTALEGLSFDPIVTRVAGTNRYHTAALLADFVTNPDTVFVATGLNYPDALAGAAAAGYLGAPLLLTLPLTVPSTTYTKLAGYDPNPRRVVVLGGTIAVSEFVSWQLFLAANS
jgi:putative cell wall-binding protein